MDAWEVEELERIVAEQDRSATFALIDRLTDPRLPSAERDQVVHALSVLADPRSVDRLVGIAEDVRLDAAVRGSALDALADAGLCPEGGVLRRWWSSGDVELQKQALIEAERTEVDIIGPVARDPSHPLHEQAIWGLEFGFEEPEWQQLKVRALEHPSKGVRRAAARILLWDEPVAAETALHDAASDEDAQVAIAAIETLEYYPSRATLAVLHGLTESVDGERLAGARQSFDRMRDAFLTMLLDADDVGARDELRSWMRPVWHLLDFTDADLHPEPGSHPSGSGRPPAPIPPPTGELLASLSDFDSPWQPKFEALRRYDWSAVPEHARVELSEFLVTHPDAAVRDLSARALAAWNDTDPLLRLAHDPVSFVRKSAVYYLYDVPQSSEVAELTWRLISMGEVASTRGHEALRTYVAHAPLHLVTERLIELALHDQRESIRYEAVCLLDPANIGPALVLLTQPPLLTWAVHSMLLTICTTEKISPPRVDHLNDVDHLQIATDLVHLRRAVVSRTGRDPRAE